MHDADQRRRPAVQADRNGEGRELVHEVERAVERIEEPAQLVVAAARVAHLFFGLDRVAGKLAAQACDDRSFAGDVGRGHEVARDRFRRDFLAPQVPEVLEQDPARVLRGLDGHGQHALEFVRFHRAHLDFPTWTRRTHTRPASASTRTC
jgi:hypothetical protein